MKSNHRTGNHIKVLRNCIRDRAFVGALMLVLCLVSPVWALDPAKTVFQFNCRNWTRQNGLPVDKISGVAQTKDGYLWLGTQNGLLCFDGREFKSVPIDLPTAHGQDIWRLTTAPDGTLRFCINNGGSGGFDGNKFFPVVPPEQYDWTGLTIMVAHDGATWFGGNAGWGRRSPNHPADTFFETDTNLGIVVSMCEDAAGRIWLGTSEQGLYLWENDKIVARYAEPSLMAHGISALAADGTNRLWIGTPNGLHCLTEGKITDVPGFNNVSTLLVDRHGTLWVGTTGGGLLHYEKNHFVAFTKEDGLVSDFVTSLFEDAEGNLWIGTRDGLSQLSDVKFPIVSSKEGIVPGSCHSVAPDRKGGLWIAAATGLSYFNGAASANFTAAELPDSAYFKLCFVARNGDVYAEDGNKNIDVFSGGKLARRITNSVWISAFGEDSQGIIVGRGAGQPLFRLKDDKFVPYKYLGSSPNYYWINNLCCAHDGAIWVACNNGLYRVQDGAVQQWGNAQGLPSLTVQCVFEDTDGSIWAGLTAGIVRIKNGQLKSIKIEDGLADGCIYAIVPDDFGSFWFCSSRGIFRASRKNLNEFADGTTPRVVCEMFDSLEAVKAYGRTDQEFSGCKTTDGRIWFPSPWGVIMIDPAHLMTNRIAPPVHVDRVLANGRVFPPKRDIVVPPGQGQLEFDFDALSFITPERIRFRYKLEGFDNNWVDSGDRRQAVYTNLKPGRYQFHVTAANSDGVWNSTGDTVGIELRPYFQQTAAFYVLCGGLGLALLGGLYFLRVRRLELRQRTLQKTRDELETEVKYRTAELAKSLSVLNAAIESTADGLLVVDRQERVVSYNRKFVEMWRVPTEKMTAGYDGQFWSLLEDMVKEDQLLRAKLQKFDHQPDAETFDVIELKDGRIFERYSLPQRLDGKIVGRVWSFRDVTERKRIEREIVGSRNFLDRIINSISDPIFVKNQRYQNILVNDAFCNLLGHKREDLLGKSSNDHASVSVKEAGAFESKDRAVLETGQEDVSEEMLTSRDGQVHNLITKKTLYINENGEKFIVGVTRDVTNQKKIEGEIVESRNFLDRIINSINHPIHVKDRQHRWVLVNDAACRFLEASRQEILGKTVQDTIGRPVSDSVVATDRQVLETGREIVTEESFTDRAGNRRTIVNVKNLYVDDKGEPFIVGMTEDITERKNAETELRWKTAFLEALLASALDGVLVVNDQGRKVFQNQRVVDLWKIPREIANDSDDARQMQFVMSRVKNPQQFVETVRRLYGQSNEVSHDEIEFIDGTILDRNSYPVVGQDGTRYGRIWQFRDVTDRKHAEAQLAYERDLLRALLDNSPDSIFFKDLQSRLVKVSKSEAKNLHRIALSGYRTVHPNESADKLPPHLANPESFHQYIIGKTDADVYGSERAEAFLRDEQEIIRTGQPIVGRIEQTICADGSKIWHLTTKVPWRDTDGNIIGTFGTAQDISDLKNAEARAEVAHQRLLDVSRQAGMAEVATNVLHNVGNVLNSVNVSASLVADSAKKSRLPSLGKVVTLLNTHIHDLGAFFTTDPRGQRLPGFLDQLAEQLNLEQQQAIRELELLRQNIEHIKDIVSMQQNYAKISGVSETVKVSDLVEDALRINVGALARHRVQIIREYVDAPTLTLEKHRVLQILVNLIRNAKYACDDSGRQDKQLKIRISRTGGNVEIAVSDNGVGISHENLARIFSHGFTTRKGGHGFGLHSGALSAREMGGSLTVHSDGPGRGAVFILALPIPSPKTNL